jgi:hypothetical protein
MAPGERLGGSQVMLLEIGGKGAFIVWCHILQQHISCSNWKVENMSNELGDLVKISKQRFLFTATSKIWEERQKLKDEC